MAAAGISTAMTWPVASGIPFYAAESFLAVSILYRSGASNPFRKTTSGKLAASSWIWNGPYLLLSVICFRGYCLVVRHPALAAVARNLYFGRRLTPREARKSVLDYRWHAVLDVAAEFSEVRSLRKRLEYKSLPLMDASAPTTAQLDEAVAWITQAEAQGPVFVHCAFGHGRSACVVIGYLLSIGELDTIADGVLRLRALRPGVRLTQEQVDVLRPLERRSA